MRFAIDEWCHGKNWVGRGLFLVWLLSLAVRLLIDPDLWTLFGAINLGIHEIGHMLFAPFGEFFYLHAAGGTILQLAAPIAAAIMFLRQPDYFGVTVAGVWLGTNLYNVGWYIGDARSMALPLASVGGGEVYHDWNHILGGLGLLGMHGLLSGLFVLLGFVVMWSSLAAAAYLLWRMAHAPRPMHLYERLR